MSRPMHARHEFRKLSRCLTVLASAFLVVANVENGNARERNYQPTDLPAGSYQDSQVLTQAALQAFFLSKHTESETAIPSEVGGLEAFYAGRDFRPLWTGSQEATLAAAKVQAVLAEADTHGLDSATYGPLGARTDYAPEPGKDAAAYDMALTRALLRYAHDVRVGRVAANGVYKDANLPQPQFDATAALTSALKDHSLEDFLRNLPPSHPQYHALRQALIRYRAIAVQGGWPSVNGTSDANGGVSRALITRLAMEDHGLANSPNASPADLDQAIKRYQARNGLKPDGKLGPVTLSALNVPVQNRIRQIAANMERWRWMPSLERRYISVNVPDQSLEFIDDGKVIFQTPVIVGRKTTPTPILRTVANTLVANPPWNIPSDIAANQLLPHLKRDPHYLAAHNMVVVNGPAGDPSGTTIDWDSIPPNRFPYAIRQLPSPSSALGVLMIDAPNDFDVYLHDTPGKKLFEASEREISNGCVRVQQIMPLASLALTHDPSSGLSELNEAIASRETRRLNLADPVPIYMVYWTAIADENGNIGFRPDRYGRDAPVIVALGNQVLAIR